MKRSSFLSKGRALATSATVDITIKYALWSGQHSPPAALGQEEKREDDLREAETGP